MADRDEPVTKWLRASLLSVSLLLLAASHIVLGAESWLGLPADRFSFLEPLSCISPPLCALNFPTGFGIALIAIVVALILFYVAPAPIAQRKNWEARDLSVASLSDKFASSVWSRRFRIFLMLALPAVVWLAVVSIASGNPPPLLWLLSVTLAAVTFYCADRASQRSPLLTRKEFALLIGYTVFVLALGFAFRNGLTRFVAMGVALLVAAWLWRTRKLSREFIAVVMLVMVAFALYTFDLMSWRYAFIGDEYAFYEYANNILRDVSRPYLFSPQGAYDVHPVFATYAQIATIMLYGNDVYGWRISETLAVMLAALPLYVLLRQLVNTRVALLALVVYLSSEHLLGITKVGYTYSQLLVPLLSAFALCVLALWRGSLLGVFLSGTASAFAFYTFAFGIPFIALTVLLFGLCYLLRHSPQPLSHFTGEQTNTPLQSRTPSEAKRSRRMAEEESRKGVIIPIAALILGVGLTAMPSLSDPRALQRIAAHTVANSEVKAANTLAEQIIPNFLYTLSASLTFLGHSHYVSGAHLDPLSSISMLLGVGAAIITARRRRITLWLLLSFLLGCVFVGGFAPYPYPPIARTYILIPFYALFAAIGAEQWFARVPRLSTPSWIGLLLLIPAFNLYQFFFLTDRVNPQEDLALLVREFQEHPEASAFYLVAHMPFNENATHRVLRAYNLDPNKLLIVSDDDPQTTLPLIKRSARTPYEILVAWNQTTARDPWRTQMRALWPDTTETLVADETSRTHFARLSVAARASDNVPAAPTTTGTTPYAIAPAALPHVIGQWPIERPRDVAVSGNGSVYIINGAKNVVEVFDPEGKPLRTLSDDWQEPFALALNSRQELLVLDSAARSLTLMRADGARIARTGDELGLSSPRGLTLDADDNVYVADTGGGRIVRLDRLLREPEVVTTTIALQQPSSLTFVGNKLIVTDGPTLYVLSSSGEAITQWPITPYNTTQPPRFLPRQTQTIAMTNPESGEFVLFDGQGHVMQKFGPPRYEPMRKPMGVAATSDGKIFIAENEGNNVRMIDWGAP